MDRYLYPMAHEIKKSGLQASWPCAHAHKCTACIIHTVYMYIVLHTAVHLVHDLVHDPAGAKFINFSV